MRTLQEFLPLIRRLGRREAVRWSNGFRTWTSTYADLYGAIGAVTNHFDRVGISKGTRVLISAENQFEWVAVFWACVAGGIEVVPVDYRFSRDLVKRIEAESKPQRVPGSSLKIATGLRIPMRGCRIRRHCRNRLHIGDDGRSERCGSSSPQHLFELKSLFYGNNEI